MISRGKWYIKALTAAETEYRKGYGRNLLVSISTPGGIRLMSTPLPCDNHPDQLAVVLTTNLEAGETLTLCWPCTLEWAQMLIGVSFPEQTAQPAEPAAAEEVADLEPEPPAPDASAKTEPEPAPPPAPKAKRRAQAAQETATPSE